MGFCHGQDRAFQIEGLVRVARGTLAEVVGREALDIDRISRRVGFRRAADEHINLLGRHVRMVFQAYSRGVNDGRRLGSPKRSHEMALLRSEPTEFAPADVLAVGKLLAFTAASNWDSELARLKILVNDGPDALAALTPVHLEPQTAGAPAISSAVLQRVTDDLALLASAPGLGGGSNNWAIAPSRTSTGRPILANDVHLPPMVPPVWYLARIRTPEWGLAGASFIGTPICPAGHNGHAAWGVTYGLVDNTDLYIEELSPDGSSVRHGDEFVPLDTVTEVIAVKGGEPVEERVLITPRGPVISPALDGVDRAISIRATWLDPAPAEHAFDIRRIRSFEDFRRVWSTWPFMSLNMVYADTSGSVGWQLVGDTPKRRKGMGTLPMPGWDPDAWWEEDLLPFDELPNALDPDDGFVATGNGSPTGPNDGPYLGVDWDDGYRAARITEVLESRADWDVASVMALQMDNESIPWREVRDVVLSAPGRTRDARLALDLLRGWNGLVVDDSAAATIFEFLLAGMARRVAQARAPNSCEYVLGQGFNSLAPRTLFGLRRVAHLSRLLREMPEGWLSRSWREEIAAVLAETVATLRRRFGRSVERWQWGRVRPIKIEHLAGRNSRLAGRIFNLRPFPWGGDTHTVSQASVDFMEPTDSPFAIAVLRMTLDVGNWESNRFILPGGQSGNPLSPHYEDMLPLWRAGEGITIAWSEENVARVARSMLRLTPETGEQ